MDFNVSLEDGEVASAAADLLKKFQATGVIDVNLLRDVVDKGFVEIRVESTVSTDTSLSFEGAGGFSVSESSSQTVAVFRKVSGQKMVQINLDGVGK
jgi:hypothetical protein